MKIWLLVSALFAVTAAGQPRFEEASVKRTDQCGAGKNSMGPGTVVLRGVPLKPVLVAAFKMRNDQITGPSWLEDDCFEIVGKMPEGSTSDQVPAMLQALLAARFKLAAHKEDRPHVVYALLVDKNGPKFKEAEPSTLPAGSVRFVASPGLTGFKGAMTMASLVRRLSSKAEHPVQDFTGLKGTYDIDLSWATDERPADADPAPLGSLFTALRESLGLRLEARKEPDEVLVIDHIERVPTQN
jgi:uncharacterized protein (TIGR03435 family)